MAFYSFFSENDAMRALRENQNSKVVAGAADSADNPLEVHDYQRLHIVTLFSHCHSLHSHYKNSNCSCFDLSQQQLDPFLGVALLNDEML